MRTLIGMPAAEIIILIVLAVLVIALISFARQFHDLMQRLANQVEADRVQQERLEATVDRLEAGAGVVAKNLASSIDRADAADDTVPGSSADAALRTGDE